MTPASRDDERLATIFKAMGHPLRLRLLRDVARGELCVSELRQQAESTQATISQHLGILRERGLVMPQRKGNTTCYRLSDKRIVDLISSAKEVFGLGSEPEVANAQAKARE